MRLARRLAAAAPSRSGRGGAQCSSRREPLRDEFAELEAALSDPAVHTDLARARKVGRRYAELTPIVRGMDRVRAG